MRAILGNSHIKQHNPQPLLSASKHTHSPSALIHPIALPDALGPVWTTPHWTTASWGYSPPGSSVVKVGVLLQAQEASKRTQGACVTS